MDLEVSGFSRVARVAIRRQGEARMFVLPASTVLTFSASGGVGEPSSEGEGEQDAEPGEGCQLRDLWCTVRRSLQDAGIRVSTAQRGWESWELQPGPLYWRLPRNTRDTEFRVGSTLRQMRGEITLKVVSDRGVDWRGCPVARVRVVQGGLHAGKLFNRGSMYVAKIVPGKKAAEGILGAHKRISGLMGAPQEVVQLQGAWQVEGGAWLVCLEDFGESARDFFARGRQLTAEDADRCAADLLAGVSAMHQHGMHHLALSPLSVQLCRDGLGRLRLKLANLGVAEYPSCPLPPGYAPQQSYLAPELAAPHRLQAVANAAVGGGERRKAKKSADELSRITAMLANMSAQLAPLGSLPLLPSLQRRGGEKTESGRPPSLAPGQTGEAGEAARLLRLERLQLLREFPSFLELPRPSLERLASEFEGPFQVPAGRAIFRTGDQGDFLYFVLAGSIVARRGGGRELSRYRRGDFLGEAALLGATPSQRIFTASAPRGEGGCAVLRMRHSFFAAHLRSAGSPLVALAAPSRWRFLSDTGVPFGEPRAADVFAAGALWVDLVSSRNSPLQRVRRVTSVEELRAVVSTFDLGEFYFTVQERRMVALITLLLRRASPAEALRCLEDAGGGAVAADEQPESKAGREHHSEGGGHAGPFGALAQAWDSVQGNVKSAFELSPASELASDAVLLGSRARQDFQDQWGRLQNDLTNRQGQFYGEVLGEIYGGLFAKDLLWIFRKPSRAQRFPVLLVRDAEKGSLPARWRIAAFSSFESELCRRTLPLVLPSLRPALKGGFEIGAAVGRNRAVNFKRLWIDAFLGSFVKRIGVQLRIKLQRAKGSQVVWETLGKSLRDAVTRGQAARREVLLRSGVLPTKYDQNAPAVLALLPDQWVPDIGLPLANGIGRGFFTNLRGGFRRGRRQRYVRPKFETWDLEDVPLFIRDFAREQGAWQAELVASSVGDTIARDVGLNLGNIAGHVWGFTGALLGRAPSPGEARREVAGGYLENREELLELNRIDEDDD